MTTEEIAGRLVKSCRNGDFDTPHAELFARDAVSIEPHETPDYEKETKGLDAIVEKGKKWAADLQEMHTIDVSEPIIAGNAFACTMRMHVTTKSHGEMDMTELCVYEVKDGKIVSERFFV